MKISKNKYLIQKKISHFSLLILASIIFASCSKDDGPNDHSIPKNQVEIENSIYGQWSVLSGNLSFGESKFIHFNLDNTIHLLEEDDQGFRTDLISPIEISAQTITIVKAEQGTRNVTYRIENEQLTINQEFGETVVLEKSSTQIQKSDEWIKTLSVQSKGNVSLGRVDIAYDGEFVLGYDEADRVILKVDPNSYEITGSFDGGEGVIALDIEKSDNAFRQLFKATNRESATGFSSYIYTSNEYYFSSNGIRAPITGLASEKPNYIWASSNQESLLFYYKSNGSLSPGEVLQTFYLDFNPQGLDYRDGFLYLLHGPYIHKCRITTELQVVETFKIPGYYFSGITYDGTNFILNAYDTNEESYTLLRTDLSI